MSDNPRPTLGAHARRYGKTAAARAAAQQLADDGKHVHYVAHGGTECLGQHCPKEAP